jgi:hypothetical protein
VTAGRARLLVGVLAAALAFALFGPSVPYLGKAFLGLEYVDHYGTQWFYWYVDREVAHLPDAGRTDLFFYPWGKDLYAHTGANILDAVAAVPFRRLFGPVLGYNLFVLAGIVGTAVAFLPLAARVGGDAFSRGVGALLLLSSPYVLFEALEGRPTQAILALLVFFLYALLRLATTQGVRWPLLAGLALALLGYQYWFYAVFAGLAAVGHGLVSALRAPDARAILARHALAAGVALAATAPVALPLVFATAAGAADVPGLLDAAAWTWTEQAPRMVEGTTVGLFEWQPLRLAAGYQVLNPTGQEVFLTRAGWGSALLPILALAFALSQGSVRRGPLLAMLAVALLFVTGPTVLVGGLGLPNPLYIALAQAVPFLRRLWWPARAWALIAVLLPLFAVAVLDRVRVRWGALPQVAMGVALWAFQAWTLHADGMLPFPQWDASIPAGYRCLATGAPGAVIELPFAWNQAHLYYQSAHGRPILGGMIEDNPVFAPAEVVELREHNGMVSTLLDIARFDETDAPRWPDGDAEAVRALGYRYVVLQRDAFYIPTSATSLQDDVLQLRQRHIERALRRLLGETVYQDARIAIYAPFGDPSPCRGAEPEPDARGIGRTDDDPVAHMAPSGEEQAITRPDAP